MFFDSHQNFRSLGQTLLAALLIAMVPSAADAQSLTETKIRLMADALRARDADDLEAALRNLKELSQIAPDDPAVKRLLLSVQQDLAEEQERLSRHDEPTATPEIVLPPTAASTTWSTPPDDPFLAENRAPPVIDEMAAMEAELASLAAGEEARQEQLIEVAMTEGKRAQELMREQNFEVANAVLESAIQSMPENPLTMPVIKQLEEQRKVVLLAQANVAFGAGNLDAARNALAAYEQSGPSRHARFT